MKPSFEIVLCLKGYGEYGWAASETRWASKVVDPGLPFRGPRTPLIRRVDSEESSACLIPGVGVKRPVAAHTRPTLGPPASTVYKIHILSTLDAK